MTKRIKNSQFNSIIAAIMDITADKSKNIFTMRCEKIATKLNDISKKINERILEINAEYASTDKDGNFLHEEVIVTDKNGTSKKENSGQYKYTLQRDKDRKKAMEQFWNEELEIPTNVIDRNETNSPLYKQIIERNTLTTLSDLTGILLDLPTDKDGFIDEGFVLDFMDTLDKEKQNGHVRNEHMHVVN